MTDLFKPDWAKLTVQVRPHRRDTLHRLLRVARRSVNSWLNELIDLHLPELAAEAERKEKLARRLARRGKH